MQLDASNIPFQSLESKCEVCYDVRPSIHVGLTCFNDNRAPLLLCGDCKSSYKSKGLLYVPDKIEMNIIDEIMNKLLEASVKRIVSSLE